MAEQTAMENFNSVMSAAIRKAARQLRETSLNLAARGYTSTPEDTTR